MTRIRLSPRQEPIPHPMVMPRENARRWISPFEENGARPSIPVFLTQSALNRADLHAASGPDYEVGGVLVGKWCMDTASEQQFIVVTLALSACFTRQGSIFLTFTQDSLVDLHAKMDELYPGKEIVGWYHTHPRIGIFLSGYDTWLHQHFFPEAWQVALVIEPHGAEAGFFIRREDGELDANQYFGFYELDSLPGPSVVRWHNLRPIPEADKQEGDEHNE